MGTLCLGSGLLVVNALVNNPVSNPRYWFGTVVLGLLLGSERVQRPAVMRMFLVTVLLAFLVVFPYADRYRYTNSTQQRMSLTQSLELKGDFDSFAEIANAVSYSQERGHTDGGQVLGALGFWVPRSAWPTKSSDTGILLAHYIGYPNTNLSAPLWAEAYIDFGWLAVGVVFLALGLVSERGDRAYEKPHAGPWTRSDSVNRTCTRDGRLPAHRPARVHAAGDGSTDGPHCSVVAAEQRRQDSSR